MENSLRVKTAKDDPKEELIEVIMNGGPPWGFTISGGSEFGTDLFVKRVRCLYCLFSIRCECLKSVALLALKCHHYVSWHII